MKYMVYWLFRNDHEWSNEFDSDILRHKFINCCGLVTHPDIIRVWTINPDGTEQIIKEVHSK